MRHQLKIPRILKINWVKGHLISVVFNNGQSRIIPFDLVLNNIGISHNSPAGVLYKQEELAKVSLIGNTLSWENVDQTISLKDGTKRKVPFEIGADVLFTFSKPEERPKLAHIGSKIREARLKNGLTQKDLALRSGTSRSYISKIENGRSDLELSTLEKIVESGLGKKLEFSIT